MKDYIDFNFLNKWILYLICILHKCTVQSNYFGDKKSNETVQVFQIYQFLKRCAREY